MAHGFTLVKLLVAGILLASEIELLCGGPIEPFNFELFSLVRNTVYFYNRYCSILGFAHQYC